MSWHICYMIFKPSSLPCPHHRPFTHPHINSTPQMLPPSSHHSTLISKPCQSLPHTAMDAPVSTEHSEGAGHLALCHAHLHVRLSEGHPHSLMRVHPHTHPKRGRGHHSPQADWQADLHRSWNSSGHHSHQDCVVLRSSPVKDLHTHTHKVPSNMASKERWILEQNLSRGSN